MNEKELIINRKSAITFNRLDVLNNRVNNMFFVTHLGQLKQMEALIISKNLKKNLLVVLFTTKNLVVPQTVHDKYSDLFEAVIFFEIPFGSNKYNYTIYKKLERDYLRIISSVLPLNVYLNSFESHYSLLAISTKFFGITLILVEEGTATYKNINDYYIMNGNLINLYDLKSDFMETIGKTQHFKKLVRYRKDFKRINQSSNGYYLIDYLFDGKISKNNKELYSGVKRFVRKIIRNEKINRSLINKIGSRNLRKSLLPFKDFDKAFVSHPKLVEKDFQIKNIEFFLAHSFHDSEAIKYAENIIEEYGIRDDDILFVSQRYFLDPYQYLEVLKCIIIPILQSDQKLFIKLHPKEETSVSDIFASYADKSQGKVVLIKDNQFLIETVIKLVKFYSVIGITSTTLVYTPLISPQTRVISIANSLIQIFEESEEIGSQKNIINIKAHLKILKRFQNIEFI